MRLMAFLGTGTYQPTTYWWTDGDGQIAEACTAYAPVAAARMTGADEAVLLGTEEAAGANLDAVRDELASLCPVRWSPVPAGYDEEQLWGIFQALADGAEGATAVALDVTHGFRSQPMVALLAAAFLQSSRQVDEVRVVYGAWEARQELADGRTRSPMIDLSPMFDLIAWAAAADRFVGSGDAEPLAQLLHAAKPPYHESRGDRVRRAQSKAMGLAVAPLRQVSRALRLTRPREAMEEAATLGERLEALQEGLPPQAAPFARLLAEVRAAYQPMAQPKGQGGGAWPELARQRAQLDWYLGHGQYAQAATLAREWLVSWMLARSGETDLVNKCLRDGAETKLGEAWACAKAGHRVRLEQEEGLPSDLRLAELFGVLGDVRNDINHAGMRADPEPADALREKVRDLVGALARLPLE